MNTAPATTAQVIAAAEHKDNLTDILTELNIAASNGIKDVRNSAIGIIEINTRFDALSVDDLGDRVKINFGMLSSKEPLEVLFKAKRAGYRFYKTDQDKRTYSRYGSPVVLRKV